ncbi:MAG: HAD-IIB family hydrolase [Coleofasciculaceae cyanobacterium SM2_1_6]|nr:HAD-IIB family hydrolase [Coleofasciculaceae cyanobacterium SM2_1_6]
MVKFLLATDLDNTLVGDLWATIGLNQRLAAARQQFYLVYATGRSLDSFRQLQQEFHSDTNTQLLEPDYLVAGVGTEIYHQGQLDQEWAAHLSQHWQREAITKIGDNFPALIYQPDTEQNPWKVSYYLQPTAISTPSSFLSAADLQNLPKQKSNKQIIDDLRLQLAAVGLSAQVVFSSNRDVDILPYHGDKGQAVRYLQKKLRVNSQFTLVCGDSGNDITMFQEKTLGVMVGNSQPELLEWHEAHPEAQHYLARSTYANAIWEAIEHFQLLSSP